MKRLLNFELVPDGCWHSNLRYILKKEEWDFIKNDVKKRSNFTCQICGKKTKFLDAHERFFYDEKTCTQKLVDVIAVCKDCHSAIHIGFTSLKGDVNKAEDHYMKVNNCSYIEMKNDLKEANLKHVELNKIFKWRLDLTWLKRYTGDK